MQVQINNIWLQSGLRAHAFNNHMLLPRLREKKTSFSSTSHQKILSQTRMILEKLYDRVKESWFKCQLHLGLSRIILRKSLFLSPSFICKIRMQCLLAGFCEHDKIMEVKFPE